MTCPRIHRSRFHDERGFFLVTVLIFLAVLTVGAFGSALLTRTDLQVVNNISTSKAALAAAEAGVTEAKLRLNMSSPTTINGYNAWILPRTDIPDWKGYILASTAAPVAPTSPPWEWTWPTIGPTTNPAVVYSASSKTDPAALKMEWKRVTPTGPIQYTTFTPNRAILVITSTGQVGNARRQLKVWAYDTRVPAVLTSFSCPGITLTGGATLNVDGGIQVNATCANAISGANNTSVTASGNFAQVNVVSTSVNSSTVSPSPNLGAPRQEDPLANLKPPCFPSSPTPCQTVWATPPVRGGSAASPTSTSPSANTTIQSGVYYGGLNITANNVTMAPGVYVMAGGGFRVTGTVNGSGVMIYNTNDPVSPTGNGAYGHIEQQTSNSEIRITAPAVGDYYQDVAIFQDRSNTLSLDFQGGQDTNGEINGTVYALNAAMNLQGGIDMNATMVIGSLSLQGNSTINPPDNSPLFGPISGYKVISWTDY
jgi:hypothetical protein